MMSTEKYTPILKWKAAEMTALNHVPTEHKKLMTPLLEVVLPSVNIYKDKQRKQRKSDEEIHAEMVNKMISERLNEIPKEIEKYWGDKEAYLDVTLLHDGAKTNELKILSLNTILNAVKEKNLNIIPVINIADNSSIVENVSELISKNIVKEICLRVTPSSLNDMNELEIKISNLLETISLNREAVHLLIDLKYLDTLSEPYSTLFELAQKIKNLNKFQEFIFSSGAFPIDMTDCSFEEADYLPRTDWMNWESNVINKKISRIPTYSDYSIRHPVYSDSLQFYESTSTLKYTVESKWMIMKGKKRALEMYLTHAHLLVQQPEFNQATYGRKETFSFGDEYIMQKAKHFEVYRKDHSVKGMGRTQDWITAGISHHTAVVIHQLSSLRD